MRLTQLLVSAACGAALSPAQVLRFELEPNGSSAQANSTACEVHMEGQVGVAGDQDWYAFTLAAPARVLLMVSPGPGGAVTDTELWLYDSTPAQALLAFNDDDVRSWMSTISIHLPAGTYYAMVKGWGNSTGGYALDLACDSNGLPVARVAEAAEPNGPLGAGTTTSLACGEIGDGDLTAADTDWWTFTLTSPSIVRAETGRGLSVITSIDTIMTLWDVTGSTQLEFDDDGAPGNWSLIIATLDPGTYHLDVGGYAGTNTGSYTLLLECTDASVTLPEMPEPNGDPFANPLAVPSIATCGVPGEGEITAGDRDWWLFGLNQDRFVTIQVWGGDPTVGAGPLGNAVLTLRDALGNAIETDDDDFYDRLPRLQIWLPVGAYYVDLGGVGNDVGSYTVQVNCDDSADYHVFAGGCPGSSGLPPTWNVRDWELPLLGTTLVGEFGQCPANGALIVFAGFSRTQAGGLPLPFDLGPLGAPGCLVEVENVATLLFIADGGGRASWPLTFPYIAGLVGVQFGQQAFVLDNSANPLGGTVTNSGWGLVTATR